MRKTPKHREYKAVAAGLAFALGAFAIPNAFGADSYPPRGEASPGSAQPVVAGYRVQDIRDWSPETDPFSAQLRATVPLQSRIDHNPATQVRPELDGKAQVMLMQGDYGNSFFGSTTYNNTFGDHTLNFWQYADYWAPWHGAASKGVPQSLYDPPTSDWRNRGFEFGILSIPTPQYTNAAHRNGVKSIAVIYFDPFFRPGLTFSEMFDKDSEGYIIGRKLVEMAKYYGFDGYFLNQEERGSDPSEFKPLMAYLTAQGLWTQWYDVNSSFDEAKASWLKDKEHGQIHNSVFVNYGGDPHSMRSFAESHGYDPYAEVFAGIEANQTGFASPGNVDRSFTSAENHSPVTSLALFTPSDMYQRGLDDDIKTATGRTSPEFPFMQQDEYQWMVAQRERMYFSGPRQDVTQAGAVETRPEVGVTKSGWPGVADFTPARSVISGQNFATDFSTGKGLRSYTDGQVSNDSAWSDMGAQAILPSWQWWITNDGTDTKMQADFDYGTEPRFQLDGTPTTPPFTPRGAWAGGNSLAWYGNLHGTSTLRLFKTDLEVTAASNLALTWQNSTPKPEATASETSENSSETAPAPHPQLAVRLDFAGAAAANAKASAAGAAADDAAGAAGDAGAAANNAAILPLPAAPAGDGWQNATLDLSEYAGKRISMISLVATGEQDGLQVNLGALALSNGQAKPDAPAGLRIDEMHSDGQMVASWQPGNFANVDYYLLEGVDASGTVHRLGKTYGDTYYVKNVGLSGNWTLRLTAIGKDGSRSEPCDLAVPGKHMPQKLTYDSGLDPQKAFQQATKPGEVTLSWEAPSAGAPENYTVTLENIYAPELYAGKASVQVPGTQTTVTLPAPPEGLPFRATVSAVQADGSSVATSLRGRYHDAYAKPLTQQDLVVQADSFHLRNPSAQDWQTLDLAAPNDHGKTLRATRGSSADENARLTRERELASPVSILLTDYAGNVSAPVTVSPGGQIDDAAAPEIWVSPWTEQKIGAGGSLTPITVRAVDNFSAPEVAVSIEPDLQAGEANANAAPEATAPATDTATATPPQNTRSARAKRAVPQAEKLADTEKLAGTEGATDAGDNQVVTATPSADATGTDTTADGATGDSNLAAYGLSYDPQTRTVSGAPNWEGVRILRFTATDAAGNKASVTVRIEASGPAPAVPPAPTTAPSTEPSTEPTTEPTTAPGTTPTTKPSTGPSTEPSMAQSTEPSTSPTPQPSAASADKASQKPAGSSRADRTEQGKRGRLSFTGTQVGVGFFVGLMLLACGGAAIWWRRARETRE
ncbi:endo-beta-N-acetylglucosaminidase [Actinobaculum suis]|uniref:endo-beta-N-acetylglucosaminidase n=1 Tax=Actinobaculum suis TaxID=1657 RepID=UPI000B07F70E|nr:cell wall protein [Actinobaculum suis]